VPADTPRPDHTPAPSDLTSSRARTRHRWRIAIGFVIVALLGTVAVWSLAFRSYVNEGDSMMPTLASGERLVVSRFGSAGVGDVVVALASVDDGGSPRQVVKRLVAVGGDTVSYVGCRLVRNGVPVEDSYDTIDEPCVGEFPEIIVPDRTVFLLGDNRPGSSDSRSFGPVPSDDVVGVVVMTL
jgi:signal peptidase I